MPNNVKTFLEDRFSSVMLISVVIGLSLPAIQAIPNWTISFALAILIFNSAFKVRLADLSFASFRSACILYVARFIVLPILLFKLMSAFSINYAQQYLFFSLIPAGVASPSIANQNGGNVVMAMLIVTISSLATPFVLPIVMMYVSDFENSIVNFDGLFTSLFLIVILPILIHALFRKKISFVRTINNNSQAIGTLLIAYTVIVVAAKLRDLIFNNPYSIVIALLMITLVYLLYLLFGLLFYFRKPSSNAISFTCCSVVNNNALAIGLASIHFDNQMLLFTMLSDIPWILGITCLNQVFRKAKS